MSSLGTLNAKHQPTNRTNHHKQHNQQNQPSQATNQHNQPFQNKVRLKDGDLCHLCLQATASQRRRYWQAEGPVHGNGNDATGAGNEFCGVNEVEIGGKIGGRNKKRTFFFWNNTVDGGHHDLSTLEMRCFLLGSFFPFKKLQEMIHVWLILLKSSGSTG